MEFHIPLKIETLMAEEELEKQSLIPSNIQPNVFSTFCWDNNDILEETLSA